MSTGIEVVGTPLIEAVASREMAATPSSCRLAWSMRREMRRLCGGIALGIGAFFALASPASAVTGTQSLFVVGQGDEKTLFASGPISGVAEDIETGPNQEHDIFPNGTVDTSTPQTGGSQSFDPITCVGRATFTGTYQITSGSGAYAGASGGGTYQGRHSSSASARPTAAPRTAGSTSST